jgi:hypothetical protein
MAVASVVRQVKTRTKVQSAREKKIDERGREGEGTRERRENERKKRGDDAKASAGSGTTGWWRDTKKAAQKGK